MDDREYLDTLRRAVGLAPLRPPASYLWVGRQDLPALEATEWSTEFERLMRNRLIMGALRYGRLADKGKPVYDRIGSIRRRLDAYAGTGNLEHLVDIANECLLDYVERRHPKAHWAAGDDPSLHTEKKGNAS